MNTQQAIMLQNFDICTEKKHQQTLVPRSVLLVRVCLTHSG